MTETLATHALCQAGQSPWLDNISRELLHTGKLKALIEEKGLLGVTSNPTIFEKAISRPGGGYEKDIEAMLSRGVGTFEIYDALSIVDIRETCDLFRPVFESSKGEHGFVSLEVLPSLAHEEERTVAEAIRLFQKVDRPNCMIKVPATCEGIPAVRRLIGQGININITLMFSTRHYGDVAQAYLDGLEAFRSAGGDLGRVHSVASVFVSRIDTLVDKKLEAVLAKTRGTSKRSEIEGLFGKAAVANSKWIYQEFKKILGSGKFLSLKEDGAHAQKLLWGSTSTKNPRYPDLLYVENLVGRETVNTMPDPTLEALLDHGRVPGATLEEGLEEAGEAVRRLEGLGIDLLPVGEELQREGVTAFANSFESLMRTLELKRESFFLSKQKKTAVCFGPVKVTGLGATAQAVQRRIRALEKENFLPRFLKADPSLWKKNPTEQKVIQNRLGWLRVAEGMLGKLYEIDTLVSEIKRERIRDVVLLGMGGSSLAPEVMAPAFKGRRGPRFRVLDTTDPTTIAEVERPLDLKSTLFVVSSKSGATIETLSQLHYFYEKTARAYGKGRARELAGRHFLAITDAGSPLERLGRERKFRRIFINPPDVGGRYSALSFFGLVPAALIGIDVRSILRSARAFLSAAEKEPSLKENAAFYLGVVLGELAKQGRDKVTFWMSKSLGSFGAWVEQLIAESTGKEGKGILPIEGEEPARHEVYGQDRVFVTMRLRAHKSDLAKPVQSVRRAGFPVIEIEWPAPAAIGAEFLRWEIATTVAGALIGVNPFDEPHVQESKDNTARILNQCHSEEPARGGRRRILGLRPFAKLRSAQDDRGLVKALISLCLKIKNGGYVALLAYTQRSKETVRALARLRRILRDALPRVPVLVGFGPRYLHSMGQLYKGGRRSGIFIEFLNAESKDLKIPGVRYSFGELKRAQALGDYQALKKRGLPVLAVAIGRKMVPGFRDFEKEVKAALALREEGRKKNRKLPKT